MEITIPPEVLIGAAVASGVSVVYTAAATVIMDFFSFGGLSAVGEQASWRGYASNLWKVSRVFVPVGALVRLAISAI